MSVLFFIISGLLFGFVTPSDENKTQADALFQTRNQYILVTEESKSKVNVTVFYESFCPGSIDFIVTQLDPVARTLENYLDIKMIPYGHAKTFLSKGVYSFKCQHGPDECLGNKLQACSIEQLGNTTKAVTFNACMLNTTYAHKNGTDFITPLIGCSSNREEALKIWRCALSEHGSFLLKNYGIETDRVNSTYVPYILLDGSNNKENDIRTDLMKVICQMLQPTPKACSQPKHRY